MAARVAELDDVTYDLEVDGEPVRRTVGRRVWERRGWATVAIAFEERAPGGPWRPAKLALIRLQRSRGAWRRHAAVTLAGAEALALAGAIDGWRGALAAGDEAGDDDAGDDDAGDDDAGDDDAGDDDAGDAGDAGVDLDEDAADPGADDAVDLDGAGSAVGARRRRGRGVRRGSTDSA